MSAAGFVLTGGRSSRMGSNKAFLPIGGRPLVSKIASTLQAVADPVILIGQPQNFPGFPWLCLPDLRPNAGPLAGVETALSNTAAEYNLIVGCDMPDIDADILTCLLKTARRSSSPCVLTCDANGKQHPLLAVYRLDCLPRVRAALDAGQLKLTRFVQEVGAEILQLHSVVTNLNTPDDWLQWQRDNGK